MMTTPICECGTPLTYDPKQKIWLCGFCGKSFFNESRERRKTFDAGLALLRTQEERMQEKTMEEMVWFYREQGFSVIPLKEKDKKPNISSWLDYSKEKPQPTEIQRWLDDGLFQNVGVICGAVSSNLVVIDIDDKNIISDLDISLDKVIKEGYWVVETNKGYHFYIRHKEDPGCLTKDDKLHIEYRANGGYVVAPPSIHPSGKQYTFLNETLEPLKEKDAKGLFDNWVKTLQEKHGTSIKAKEPIPMENIEADCVKNVFKGGLTQGKRNDTAFSLVNWYKNVKKLNPTEIRALVKNWNDRNKEPLPDRELQSIVTSALKSGKSTGCNRWKQLGFCPYEDRNQCVFYRPERQISNIQSNKKQEQQRKQEQQGEQQIRIKGCGGIYDSLVIEPLGNHQYLYNYNGKKGISLPGYNKETKQDYLTIENKTYYFKDRPLKKVLFNVPSREAIQKYINGTYVVKDAQTLFKNVVRYLKILYDVEKVYYPFIAVGIFQSWLISKLQAVFYLGFEAKYGGAKTVFLEGLAILSRHGFLAGNITSAGVGRLTEKQELSLFADEIDVRTKNKDNELFEVFRIGYRRNNPYVRLKDSKHDFEEDVSDPFGFKGFSVHSEVEKALKTRSAIVPLRTSTNTKLPILNLYKDQIGRHLFEDIFFWYMENVNRVVAVVSVVSLLSTVFDQTNDDIEGIRQTLFNEILKDFTGEELEILLKFFGRNEELLYIAFNVCKALGINVAKELEETFICKSECDDSYNDNYLIGLLRDLLVGIYRSHVKKEKDINLPIIEDIEVHRLKEGEFTDCVYCGKTQLYETYRIHLKNKDIRPVHQETFSEYLLELGFNDNINIKKERFGGKAEKTLKALIFDDVALKQLGIVKETLEEFESNKEKV